MLFYSSLEEYIRGERQKLTWLESLAQGGFLGKGVVLDVLGPAEDQDKKTNVAGYSITQRVDSLLVDSLGIHGDRHRRASKPSTARERALYEKGTLIREHRHLFVVSPYDCEILSTRLDVEVTPALLGANLVIGHADGSRLATSSIPHGTYLTIAPADVAEPSRPPSATLVHYALQQGCGVTGHTLATQYDDKSLTQRFVEVSKNSRGIVCQIEYPVDPPVALVRGMSVFFLLPKGIAP